MSVHAECMYRNSTLNPMHMSNWNVSISTNVKGVNNTHTSCEVSFLPPVPILNRKSIESQITWTNLANYELCAQIHQGHKTVNNQPLPPDLHPDCFGTVDSVAVSVPPMFFCISNLLSHTEIISILRTKLEEKLQTWQRRHWILDSWLWPSRVAALSSKCWGRGWTEEGPSEPLLSHHEEKHEHLVCRVCQCSFNYGDLTLCS
jgi:hypothetical protein